MDIVFVYESFERLNPIIVSYFDTVSKFVYKYEKFDIKIVKFCQFSNNVWQEKVVFWTSKYLAIFKEEEIWLQKHSSTNPPLFWVGKSEISLQALSKC